MKIDGAMYNGMSEQYMDLMQLKSDPKKAEIKSIFYWAMGAIEMVYWEHRGVLEVNAELVVSNDRVSLLVTTALMTRAYFRALEHAFTDDEIKDALSTYVEVFNYTDSLVRQHFLAEGPKSSMWNQINIHVDEMEK